jgi:4,5-dihydroxyphthalate decarboxylase
MIGAGCDAKCALCGGTRELHMSKLRLTLACSNYDRTRSLFDGRVLVEGVDLSCLSLPIEEIFFRMLRHREFEVAEMSLSSYVVSLFVENPRFIAIPVFPSRFFRHSCIFIHSGSGIRQPKDLIGKRVGVPEYQMTAGVWIRGILSDEYGVPVSGVSYFQGGEEEPGRPEKLRLGLPSEIHLDAIPEGKTLSAMLAAGEIDALYTARMPSSFVHNSGNVRRLFENYAKVEREYYTKTKIFPIMHTIVMRRDVYERFPWIAQSLSKAFKQAQEIAYRNLYDSGALSTMLPWLTQHLEETRALMGTDFWPYGLEKNEHTLETFLRYSFEQGLSKRRLRAEDLFATETLESFKV